MRHNDFNFDLFRLTVQDDETLLDFMGEFIKSDTQIVNVIQGACSKDWDYIQSTPKAKYLWGLRDFVMIPSTPQQDSYGFALTLAKATLEKDGSIITPDAIRYARTETQPPLADTVSLVFYLNRHLVAVESKSSLTYGDGWLDALHKIVNSSARAKNYRSEIFLRPKPKTAQILKTFKSFQRLTRVRVHLLLPNPDLSRFTQKLFEELKGGGIREYLADMKNPVGLNQNEMSLPHAAVSMAEDGYKKGDVVLEGIKDGKRKSIRTGKRPSKGKVEGIRDMLRQLVKVAEINRRLKVFDKIVDEIDQMLLEE